MSCWRHEEIRFGITIARRPRWGVVRISPSCSTLILCKGKRELVVEYALRNLATPMGIAEFRHLEGLPAELKGSRPSVEEIEAELGSSSADGE